MATDNNKCCPKPYIIRQVRGELPVKTPDASSIWQWDDGDYLQWDDGDVIETD